MVLPSGQTPPPVMYQQHPVSVPVPGQPQPAYGGEACYYVYIPPQAELPGDVPAGLGEREGVRPPLERTPELEGGKPATGPGEGRLRKNLGWG